MESAAGSLHLLQDSERSGDTGCGLRDFGEVNTEYLPSPMYDDILNVEAGAQLHIRKQV